VAPVLHPCHARLLAPGRPLPTRARACATAHPRPRWASLRGIAATAWTSLLWTRVCPDRLGNQSLPPEPASCRSPHLARSRITGRVAPVPNRAPAPLDRTGQGLPVAPGCALHLKATPSLPFVHCCRHHCPPVRPRRPPLLFVSSVIIAGLTLALCVLIQQVQEQPWSPKLLTEPTILPGEHRSTAASS
jgi:hypothetical protein